MKIIIVAVGVVLLAGCGSAPYRNAIERRPVVIGDRADGDFSSRSREIALHALSQIGTRYRYGGSTPDEGFDCSGLVQYVYSRAGIVLPRTTEALSALGMPVTPNELEPGDLVFFDTLRRPFSHVGIYIGDQRFIHAPTSRGVVQLVNMKDRYWQGRYDGARRPAL
ncbi:MAG: C40 family peptidase [Burkholderiales bacterium]